MPSPSAEDVKAAHWRPRIVVTRVSNVSAASLASTRMLVSLACRLCPSASGFTGTLVLHLDAKGSVRIMGGTAALRACLTSRLAERLFRLTRMAGWLVQPSHPAVVTVTFSP